MRLCLKWPASRLFTQPFIQAQMKENIKYPRHWPLWGKFTGDRWISRTKASNVGNVSIRWRHYVIARISNTGNCISDHNDVITWKHFPRYWPFVRGIHRWPVPTRRASSAELCFFLWWTPEHTVEQIVELPMIWEAITVMWCHCDAILKQWYLNPW